MKGKLHLALGTTAGLAGGYCLLSNPLAACSYLGACMIGSLFPDIDCPGSMISKYTFGLSTVINKMFGHRGFIHTPLLLLFIHGFYWLRLNEHETVSFWLLTGFTIGFICHITQDIMTKGGIPLLYPFLKKRYSLTNFKSDHKIHNLFTIALMIGACFVVPKTIEIILKCLHFNVL